MWGVSEILQPFLPFLGVSPGKKSANNNNADCK